MPSTRALGLLILVACDPRAPEATPGQEPTQEPTAAEEAPTRDAKSPGEAPAAATAATVEPLDTVRVLAAEVADLRAQPALAEMFLREVATADPWSHVVDWAELSTRLLGRPVRQVHRLEHAGPVVGMAMTPDGRRIAAVSSEGAVRVWTIEADVVTSVDLPGARGRFRHVDISRDGGRVVAGGGGIGRNGRDSPVWLWSVEGGLVGELRGHTDAVLEMAFRPDGQAVATSSMDGTARVWDASSAAPLATFAVVGPKYPELPPGEGSLAIVGSIAWRPDGQRLATGDHSGAIHEWAVGKDRPLTTLRGHTDEITALQYSADGERLVSGAADDTARVWVTATAKLERTLELKHDVTLVSFSADRARLVTATLVPEDVRVWQLESGRAELLKGSRWPLSASFSADGAYLVTADDDLALLWRGHGAAGIDALRGHEGELVDARFTDDGRIVTAGVDGSVRVWQIDRGTRTPYAKRPYATAYSPSGARRLDGGGRDGEPTREFEGERTLWRALFDEVSAATYSPDGATIAISGGEGELIVVRSGTGELLRRWSMVPDHFPARALALRDDGTLASLSLFEVIVWDASGRRVAALRSDSEQFGHAEYETLAWSPDGAQLALATKAPELLLWRTDRPAPDRAVSLARKLEKLYDRLELLAWSADGTRLAVGSSSGRLFEYDVASLRPLARWAVDPPGDLRYSPDGERLMVVDIAGDTLTVPSRRDPTALLAALWQTNRSCPSPAEREKWLNLDAEAAVRDHARCVKILECITGGGAPASCLK